MRTVTPRSVLNGVAARMGMDITQEIPAHTVAAFLEYINSAVKSCWERYSFPQWTRIEQRTFRAAYDAGNSYVLGDEVFYADAYYRALGATTGNLPTDATYWVAAPDMIRNISLDQAGETAIGEILEIYGSDPRVDRAARRYGFSLIEDGVLVYGSVASPWVEFTLRAPVFASDALDGLTFPHVLSEPVKLIAAGEAQREDGQFEKGMALEQGGMVKLDEEFDRIELKQGQQHRWAP